MKLLDLLDGVAYEKVSSSLLEYQISDITNDSRKVKPDDLYVAIRGGQVDGHQFVAAAVAQGARCVLVEEDMGVDCQVIVPDTKRAYALVCANLFSHPARELTLVAVTGTNGKTSTTSMMQTILSHAGYRTGLIGTIAVSYGDVVKETAHTTPDAYVFQQTLREMVEAGCSHAVLEASSMALSQERLYGTEFEICVFTNLSPDHLDYHASMEQYFDAKATLFPMGKSALVNIGDPYGRRLHDQLGGRCRTFLLEDPERGDDGADFYATNVTCCVEGVSFEVTQGGQTDAVFFAIPGRYSAENALAAIGVCRMMGLPMAVIIEALGTITNIRGRCEVLYQSDTLTVIGDYAHTPDGIKNILQTLREIAPARLVALFGCGGDRDHHKRPLMATAAGTYADLVIVTSDNPRSEDPGAIIDQILTGCVPEVDYLVIPDRTEAITVAMTNAQERDLVVLLGKGHETYQVLQQGKIHYDEREIVADIAATL